MSYHFHLNGLFPYLATFTALSREGSSRQIPSFLTIRLPYTCFNASTTLSPSLALIFRAISFRAGRIGPSPARPFAQDFHYDSPPSVLVPPLPYSHSHYSPSPLLCSISSSFLMLSSRACSVCFCVSIRVSSSCKNNRTMMTSEMREFPDVMRSPQLGTPPLLTYKSVPC